MTLKYYHAEPLANSLKSMIPLIEKGLPWQSIYVDLHKFEQHEPWFLAINPEGQVPVLDHDGVMITHTTVINEYLEDVFPEVPLRPRDALGAARMRYWNKFCDEQVMNYVSMHGWHRMVGIIARSVESGEFERLMERIPLPDQRTKWRTARSGFGEKDLAYARPRRFSTRSTRSRSSSARPPGSQAMTTPSRTSISSPCAVCPWSACFRSWRSASAVLGSSRGESGCGRAPR